MALLGAALLFSGGCGFKNKPVPPAFKESVRYGEQNLYTRAKELVGDRDPRAADALSYRIEDALVLRASASLTLPHGLEARLFVDNLGGTTWFHPSNLPPSRYRQPGRTFRVQAGWSF